MNATKRLLTGAVIAAGALGIGAGAFFACRQELSPGAQDGSAGAERKPAGAKYDDGDYDLYFKNGAHIHGDCDGYNSEPGGKTTIYEYWKTDINIWEHQLKKAGVNPEMHKTSWPGQYCWARFDTSLLAGIGFNDTLGYKTLPGFGNYLYDDELDLMTENGTKLNFKTVAGVYYAQAHSNFDLSEHDKELFNKGTLEWLKQDRDVPAILIVFNEIDSVKVRSKARQTLEAAGISTLELGSKGNSHIISDASNIKWFAYNQ